MTLTIDLSPTEEARLAAAARQEGLGPAELARKLVTKHLPLPPPQNGTQDPTVALFEQRDREGREAGPLPAEERDPEHVARVKSIRGKYAHLGLTTRDLHRERQADKEREERQRQRSEP